MKVTIYKARDTSKTVLAECETDMPVNKGDVIWYRGEAQTVRATRYEIGDDGKLQLGLWISTQVVDHGVL